MVISLSQLHPKLLAAAQVRKASWRVVLDKGAVSSWYYGSMRAGGKWISYSQSTVEIIRLHSVFKKYKTINSVSC